MNERKSVWKRKRSVGGKKRKKGKQEKKRVGAYMRVLMKSERATRYVLVPKKLLSSRLLAVVLVHKFKMKWCYARSRISQKWLVPFHAESLSFPESTAIAVSVSSNIQDVFLSHSRVQLFPHFSPFLFTLDRSTILTRICAGWYQVAGEFKTLVHSFSRRRDRERERDRKIENTHKCTFIRDRGISSSSKIGNQCGFTDGAFVRDRQTRQSTTWYAVGDNAIILCGAQVRWCVAVAGWAVATAAAAAAAVVAFSFLRSSWLPAPKLCLFSFFSFSFSFNPFNPAIIIDISVNRDKSLIAMLSFSFSPHPRTVFEIIDNEYGMEMASFQWQRRSIPSREPKFRFNFIFDNRRWQTLRNPNWLICHAYLFELLAIAMAAAAAAAAFIRDHAITNDNNNNNITKRRHVRRLVRLETFDCFDAER